MLNVAGGIILAGLFLFAASIVLAIVAPFVADIFNGAIEVIQNLADGWRRFRDELRKP